MTAAQMAEAEKLAREWKPTRSLFADVRQATALGDTRWVELDYGARTITYDLTTVQMIAPGKFTIISTTVDHPDVMKLNLAVLDTLRSYCNQPDGKYAPPVELFLLGKPDMPVEKIEVETKPASRGKNFKNVSWRPPYRKLALNLRFFDCEGSAVESADEEYAWMRFRIMNGLPAKEM